VILALTFGLAGVLSSPDVPPVTIATWARVAPADFLGTAVAELNATTMSSQYGPPYNNGTGSVQRILFSPQTWPGITQPINSAQDFVIAPLTTLAHANPATAAPLAAYQAASPAQQLKWANAYATAVAKVKFVNGNPVVPPAADGPVPAMMANELTLARSGALDADLLAQQPFYGTNFTKPLLFINDGGYFANQAAAMNLTGSQWGVMNETGSYPGQPWLWLHTLWYQIPGWNHSANIDMIAIYMTGLATILLLLIPFIPGLRDIPRLIPSTASFGATGTTPSPNPPTPPPRSKPEPLARRRRDGSAGPGGRRRPGRVGGPLAYPGSAVNQLSAQGAELWSSTWSSRSRRAIATNTRWTMRRGGSGWTGCYSPLPDIRPTMASSSTRWPATATRSTRLSCSTSRLSPAA
jgi:hypothetical protein